MRISTRRTRPALTRTQGARSNHKNLPIDDVEPAGHGIGRSRGGLTTKIHHAVDGHGLPLAIVVTGGQRNDGAMLKEVLDDIRVPRLGGGRPRTRPDAVLGDKAYGSGVNRRMLRARGITVVIPEKSDQIAARKRTGSHGGRPPEFDAEAYKDRNVVERSLTHALGDRGVHAFAVHPGQVRTDLRRFMKPSDIEEMYRRAASLGTPDRPAPKLRRLEVDEGAATTVWAATSAELDGRGGLYLADCGVSEDAAPYAVDPARAVKLWELSEQLVGL